MRPSFKSTFALMGISALALTTSVALAQFDSTRSNPLRGNPQLDCTMAAMQTICRQMRDMASAATSSSSLGNRVGTFTVNANQTGYIRARACFFSGNNSNDEASSRTLTPIDGPDSTGVFTWRLSAGSEAFSQASCWFNSDSPGSFQIPAPAGTNNHYMTETGRQDLHVMVCNGGYSRLVNQRVYWASYYLDPIKGTSSPVSTGSYESGYQWRDGYCEDTPPVDQGGA